VRSQKETGTPTERGGQGGKGSFRGGINRRGGLVKEKSLKKAVTGGKGRGGGKSFSQASSERGPEQEEKTIMRPQKGSLELGGNRGSVE